MKSVGPDPSEELTAAERAWLLHSEGLWRRAHAIVSRQSDLDTADVYHALRNLELPPAERLRRGLTRVRIRPHPAERKFLQALAALEVRYLLVDMGAALIEGAPGTTQDLDLWFGSIDADKVREAARRAGGFYTFGFGLQPPAIGGEGLDRVDVVLTADGLDAFDEEYARSRDYELEDVRVRVLPLERVIESKRASKRAKDLALLPQLEATLAAKRAQNLGE